jgi:AcrR family transcriptional regulator
METHTYSALGRTGPMPSLREEQVQLTQQRILDTFENELLTNGYANVSIRSIAKHAGISVPTVYRYYHNKGALLLALLDAAASERGFNPFATLATTHDPMEAVTALLNGIWDTADERPGRIKAYMQALAEAGEEAEPLNEGFKRMAFLAREALAPLSYLPQDDLRKLQALVALMLSPQTWYTLRVGHGLPRDESRELALSTIGSAIEKAEGSSVKRGSNGRKEPAERSEAALRKRWAEASKDL